MSLVLLTLSSTYTHLLKLWMIGGQVVTVSGMKETWETLEGSEVLLRGLQSLQSVSSICLSSVLSIKKAEAKQRDDLNFQKEA